MHSLIAAFISTLIVLSYKHLRRVFQPSHQKKGSSLRLTFVSFLLAGNDIVKRNAVKNSIDIRP